MPRHGSLASRDSMVPMEMEVIDEEPDDDPFARLLRDKRRRHLVALSWCAPRTCRFGQPPTRADPSSFRRASRLTRSCLAFSSRSPVVSASWCARSVSPSSCPSAPPTAAAQIRVRRLRRPPPKVHHLLHLRRHGSRLPDYGARRARCAARPTVSSSTELSSASRARVPPTRSSPIPPRARRRTRLDFARIITSSARFLPTTPPARAREPAPTIAPSEPSSKVRRQQVNAPASSPPRASPTPPPRRFRAGLANRDDENEIAREQVFSLETNLLMGGGRRHFDPNHADGSKREDDVDLVAAARARGYEVVTDRDGLFAAETTPRAPTWIRRRVRAVPTRTLTRPRRARHVSWVRGCSVCSRVRISRTRLTWRAGSSRRARERARIHRVWRR